MSKTLLKKLFLFASIAMVAMLVLAACGDDDDDDDDADTGGDTSTMTTVDGGDVQTVTMEDTMRFGPQTLTAAAGEELTVNLQNNGAIEHNFAIDAADVDEDVDGGAEEEITFTAPSEAGEYEIYCNIPGHKEAGMVATLVVE